MPRSAVIRRAPPISITKASTTLTLGSNVLNPVFGQAVTVGVTVNTATGTPSGSVSLSDGSTALGTMNLVSGAAAFNVSNLAVGSHSLTMTYSGDGSYGSSSATLTLNVTKATVALNLSPSPSSPAFGQTLTITGTLSGSGGTPSGTLAFSEGGNPLGTAILASGAATVNLSTLAVGSHNIIAVYSGDGSFNTNSATLTINVGKAGTTLSLSGTPNPAPFGQAVQLTAAIGIGNGSPTGTVVFTDGQTVLGSSPVTAGNAVLTVNSLAVGPHSITAAYSGDSSYTSSTATLSIGVTKATGSLAFNSSPSPASFGQPLSLTTALTVGSGSATGTVFYYEGNTLLGLANVAAGQAVFTLSSLGVGTHNLTASYSGDADFNALTANLSVTIGKGAAGLALSTTPSSVLLGQPVVLKANISVLAGSPTGSVTFLDGSTQIGSAPISNGQASLTVSSLGVGSHSLTAQYSGDANYNAALGSTNLTVGKGATGIILTAAPNPGVFGQDSAFTATVSAITGSPTGTILFQDGSTSLGTATLNAQGMATLVVPGNVLAVGLHSLTASYSGDANYATASTVPFAFGVVVPVSLSTSSLNLTAPLGGGPGTGSFIVSNGGVPVTYTVSVVSGTGGNWLRVTPLSGSSNNPTPITFTTDPTGLPVGTYTATVIVTPSTGAPQTIPVTFTVGAPAVTMNAGSLLFERLIASKPIPAQTLVLGLNGGPLPYSLTTNASWLHLSSTSGTLNAGQPVPINLTVDPTGLGIGVFQGNIVVSVPGGNPAQTTIPVTLRIPTLNVQPDPSVVRTPQAQVALNGGHFAFTAVLNQSQPSVAHAIDSLRQNLSPESALHKLLFGNKELSPMGSSGSGDYTSDAITVTSVGGTYNFTATSTTDRGGNWLTVSPSTGVTPGVVHISVDKTNLAPGVYTGTVTIHSVSQDSSAQNDTALLVSFTISAQSDVVSPGQPVAVNPVSANFTYEQAQPAPAQQTLTLAGGGSGQYFAALSGGNWATLASATGMLPSNLALQVNPAGMAAGEYDMTLTLSTSANGSVPVVVPLHLSVQPQSALAVQPATLQLSAEVGGSSAPLAVMVTTTGNRSLTFTASSSAPWLHISQTAGQTNQQVTVSANAASLSPGTYNATVTVVEGGGTQSQLQVALTVIDHPQLVVVGGPVSVSMAAGGSASLAPQQIYLTSKNRQVSFKATTSTENGGNWLSAVVQGGLTQTPANIAIVIHGDNLAPGHYIGSVILSSPDLAAPLYVPVTLDVQQALPVFTSGGVVNAASMQNGLVSPNEIVTVFGSNLLCGPNAAQVMLDGQIAPVLVANNSQLSVLVPESVANDANLRVKMGCGGSTTPELQFAIQPAVPAIFTQTQTGTGAGAILNEDRSLNQTSVPSTSGKVVMVFVTGFGTFNAPDSDGLSRLTLPVSATVGGLPADVLYAGEAPGLTRGMQQINVRIPDGAGSGPVAIQINVGGQSTQNGVTVFLQ